LRKLFKAYGVELKNQSLEILVEEATASNKPVDFAAFLHMFTAFLYGGKSRATYKKVFRVFDDENMGCISAKNLRRVVKELGL
jgi:Ca2+-binding EF-hand superfamily protein